LGACYASLADENLTWNAEEIINNRGKIAAYQKVNLSYRNFLSSNQTLLYVIDLLLHFISPRNHFFVTRELRK